MSSSIYLSIAGLIYTILISIVFFSKPKIKTIENKLYKRIIVVTLCSLISELFIVIVPKINNNPLFFGAMKVYLLFCLSWFFMFMVYTFTITHTKEDENKNYIKSKYQKLYTIFKLFYIVSLIIVMVLPIKYFNENGMKYSYGPSVDYVFTTAGILMTVMVFYLIKNFKDLKKKRYYPIIVFVLMLFVCTAIQKINPSLLLVNFVFAFVTTLMYHTIENPDIHMIEELLKNREIVEKSIEDKSNLLFKITAEVKKPVKNILENAREYQNITKRAIKDEIVGNISEDAKDLYFIVNDILDVSSVTSSNIKMIDNLYFPQNLLIGIKIKQGKNIKPNVTFDFAISNAIPEKLYGDSIKFRQIVNSLINNAIKYTDSGSIEVDVSPIIKYDVCRLVVNISDTGCGMSVADINNILEGSEELSNEDKKSLNENDLSLKAIVKLVRILNGTINIKSSENKGTKIMVVLDQLIVRDKEEDRIRGLENFGRNKVMYIHKFTNKSVKLDFKIKDPNINIVSVLFANQAVDMLRNNENFELIIVNDEIPALETLKELKSVKNNKTPIVVLISNGNERLSKHYKEDGFDDYILEKDLEEDIKRIKNKYL